MQLVFCSDLAKTSYYSYPKQALFSVTAGGSFHNPASYCIQIVGRVLSLHLSSLKFRYPCLLSVENRLKLC